MSLKWSFSMINKNDSIRVGSKNLYNLLNEQFSISLYIVADRTKDRKSKLSRKKSIWGDLKEEKGVCRGSNIEA